MPGSGTQHLYSHSIGENSVTWPHLIEGRPGKCSPWVGRMSSHFLLTAEFLEKG